MAASSPREHPDETAEIESSALFTNTQIRRYLWERYYTADEYITLLDTFSGHIAMDESKRQKLYRAVRERINCRSDPRVRRHWYSILHVADRVR